MNKTDLAFEFSKSMRSRISTSIKTEDKLRIARTNIRSIELDKLIMCWCVDNYYFDEFNEANIELSVLKYFELFKFVEEQNSSLINSMMLLNGIDLCKIILLAFDQLSMENKKKHTKEVITALIRFAICLAKYSSSDKVHNPITQAYTLLTNEGRILTANDKLTPEVINTLLESIFEFFENIDSQMIKELVNYNDHTLEECQTFFGWGYKKYEFNFIMIQQLIVEMKEINHNYVDE
jgi:hypothetical protein